MYIGLSLFLYHHVSLEREQRETWEINPLRLPTVLMSLLRPGVCLKGGKMYFLVSMTGEAPTEHPFQVSTLSWLNATHPGKVGQ